MYGFVADYDGEGAKVADIAKLISGIKRKLRAVGHLHGFLELTPENSCGVGV